MVTELGVELQEEKSVCDKDKTDSEGVRLRVTAPALGLQVNLTVWLVVPGALKLSVVDVMTEP